MASSLRYSWEFKEIICVDNNKAKNNFYNTIWGQLIVCDVLGFVSLSTVNATCREDCEAHVISVKRRCTLSIASIGYNEWNTL